ncbi:MAG: RNA methyltransferase [Acidimicrobiales bacterium]|nr:RNA methyltransferase [Acidimicrobiales bacterium]
MIDGPTLVREALDAGVALQEVLVEVGQHAELVGALEATGVAVHSVHPDVLARAADTVTSQGIAAIAKRFEVSIRAGIAAAEAGPLVLVLVDIADPGNAGTLLRTAEAAGAAAVLFCGASVDPSNPKCVRASAGAVFHLPVASGGDAVSVLEGLGNAGVARVATVVRGGAPYDDADLTGPVAVVLGSEAHGLPAELRPLVDHHLTIPMEGRSESLNVAMAGAVLSFEALRQRRGEGR